jgi:phage gp36-like protein
MAYCTQQDMTDRFGADELIQLTDRAGAADAIDTTVLGQAISDADDTINGYIAGRYDLPLSSTPGVLVRNACDLAHYYLYGVNVVPDVVQKRYDAAIKYLTLLGKGEVTLGLDGDGAEADTADLPEFSSSASVFGRGADW